MKAAVRKAKAKLDTSEWPLVLRLRPAVELTEDQFFELCQLNRDLRIERNAMGELLLMTPTTGGTGRRNGEINRQLGNWALEDGTGLVFDSSTGFRLSNTAVRSPDAAWILITRYEQGPPDWEDQFISACPDFVLELRSPSDRLRDLQAKMAEYLANGARLGWLLDPRSRRVYVYRPNEPVARLDNPETVSGDPVLPGFVLDLRRIWTPLTDVRTGSGPAR
jgi:Uma2 family endonuclease